MPPPQRIRCSATDLSLPRSPISLLGIFAYVLSALNFDQISRSVGGRGSRDVAATAERADTPGVHGKPTIVWFDITAATRDFECRLLVFHERKSIHVFEIVPQMTNLFFEPDPVSSLANVDSIYLSRDQNARR